MTKTNAEVGRMRVE